MLLPLPTSCSFLLFLVPIRQFTSLLYMFLIVVISLFRLGWGLPTPALADPLFPCVWTSLYLLAGQGRNENMAGPSNYKGKEKAQ